MLSGNPSQTFDKGRADEKIGTRTDIVQISAPSDLGKTRDKLSKVASVSHDTISILITND